MVSAIYRGSMHCTLKCMTLYKGTMLQCILCNCTCRDDLDARMSCLFHFVLNSTSYRRAYFIIIIIILFICMQNTVTVHVYI